MKRGKDKNEMNTSEERTHRELKNQNSIEIRTKYIIENLLL